MSKTIRDSAWKQAKWAQEMILVLTAAGFEYEKFSYECIYQSEVKQLIGVF
jgi:hypothetical protein